MQRGTGFACRRRGGMDCQQQLAKPHAARNPCAGYFNRCGISEERLSASDGRLSLVVAGAMGNKSWS
ncbi:hypothetical protein VFPPC_16409 [Pochonia chlamydosporia 170]|uniref:Uncharacterized protein n=1 Tax=Pochonia chlamydosporia 170 TaxID=1380566 RepID=A0A179FC02_METCM|nr:hypothetical protein VFPPC_16409 [Pochonia chlamydosporia 170]OAQ62996.1 hypothetical protein VFPPC_16409 [Pochonia chlamydosporia 170]